MIVHFPIVAGPSLRWSCKTALGLRYTIYFYCPPDQHSCVSWIICVSYILFGRGPNKDYGFLPQCVFPKRKRFIFQPLLRQMLFFAGTLAQERALRKKTTDRKFETHAIFVKINPGTWLSKNEVIFQILFAKMPGDPPSKVLDFRSWWHSFSDPVQNRQPVSWQ